MARHAGTGADLFAARAAGNTPSSVRAPTRADAEAGLSQVDAWGQMRREIRQRRPDLVVDVKMPHSGRFRSVRDNPRWKELLHANANDARSGAPEQLSKSQGAHLTAQTRVERDDMVQASGPAHNALPRDDSRSEHTIGPNYSVEESTVRNDHSQNFVDTGTGRLPGNAVRNPYAESRFEEYPKLQRLVRLKCDLLAKVSHPPIYLVADLRPSLQPASTVPSTAFHLASLLPIKYDVILIDPPLEMYEWEGVPSGGVEASRCWKWNDVANLPIPTIAAKESFIFLWVGSGAADGLERGRELLSKWGYRRCEDIVWVRSNHAETDPVQPPTSSAFARSVQHCLMGIRGTVRRSTDTRFIHANIDTDVIVWEGERVAMDDGTGKGVSLLDLKAKPPEMMSLIENFCLGTRRLELFGRNRNLRRGWLTVGLGDLGPGRPGWQEAKEGRNACAATVEAARVEPVAYSKQTYDACFGVDRQGCELKDRKNLVPYDEDIDAIRPKTPPPISTSPRAAHHGPGSQGGGRKGAQRRPDGATPHDGGAARMHNGVSAPRMRGPPNVGHAGPRPAPGAIVGRLSGGGLTPPLDNPLDSGKVPTRARRSFPAGTVGGGGGGSSGSGGGGGGLSGLGAGGPRTVSKQSGSEVLSGMQVQSALGLAASDAASHNDVGGPRGLGRRRR